MNPAIQKAYEYFKTYSGPTLSILLITAAIVIVLIALFVPNNFVKAAALAYVILP